MAASNSINSLARSLGSTLASAVGGSLLAAITVTIGGIAIPSLAAYRILFTICAAAAILAAAAGWIIASMPVSAATTVRPAARQSDLTV